MLIFNNFKKVIMNQLVKVFSDIYKPTFNENNDEYIDTSPYKPYERNCIRYECRCKAGSYFIGNTMFKQHIKSKTHKDFIANYSKYYKEVDESKEIINNLKVENELLTRKNNKLKNQNSNLLKIIEELNDEDDDEEFKDCHSE
tara:strand:+ start:1488 stop:1916 length:429 start_codon:yes stop_codon:yes gene_type:complete